MLERFFKIVYLVFLFGWLSYSHIYIGPFTLNMLLAAILFLMNIAMDSRIKPDKTVVAYIVFILSLGITSVISHHSDYFWGIFFRYYLVSLIGWKSTTIILSRKPDFSRYIIGVIVLIGILDAFVTMSQFTMMDSWYSPIEKLFGFQSYDDYEANTLTISSEVYTRFIPGIFGNPVINGYYLAICVALSFYYVHRFNSLFLFLVPSLLFFGVFCCQERSALILSAVALIYLTYRYVVKLSRSKKILVFAILISVLAYVTIQLVSISNTFGLRYTSLGFDDTGRSQISKSTMTYLWENFLCPNLIDQVAQVGHAPHNLFLNAFIYGGLVSFVSIMYILIKQCRLAGAVIINKVYNTNYILRIIVCAWIVFTLNGLVHNRSIVTGELICWILWAMMQTLSKEHKEIMANKVS